MYIFVFLHRLGKSTDDDENEEKNHDEIIRDFSRYVQLQFQLLIFQKLRRFEMEVKQIIGYEDTEWVDVDVVEEETIELYNL